jgi:uncharacterized protein
MVFQVLKQSIIDFQNSKTKEILKRDFKFRNIEGKALIFIGVRRSGKSTLLFQMINELVSNGINVKNIMYLNFFDDRFTEIKAKGLSTVIEAYYSIYPEKKGSEEVYFFFDEIQEVPEWEAFVDRILRTEMCKVFITGSSAKMLSKEIATSMRGRSLSFEVFPFSFSEFLKYKGHNDLVMTTKNKLIIQNDFEEYFSKGGFPEVRNEQNSDRIIIHQEYFRTIMWRDVIERYNLSNPQAVIQLGYRLMTSCASLYSLNRLTAYLKSLGFKTSKEFVFTVLSAFEDCYFLFSVPIYDKSESKRNVNPKKIYCVDHAMMSSIDPQINEKRGQLLENMVFSAIRRASSSIFYYKTASGKEVDFCWIDINGRKNLVQVSFDLNDEKTRKREVSAIIEAMDEIKVKNAKLVTMNESDILTIEDKTIEIIPAWEYLMNFKYSEKSVFQINDLML